MLAEQGSFSGRRTTYIIKYCLTCNKKMEVPPWRKKIKYCSRECQALSYTNKCNPKTTGQFHWNWQGGKTRISYSIRKTLKMREWRDSVFKRDNWTCQICGANGGRKNPLNAHHLIRFYEILDNFKIETRKQAKSCKELWDISNGLTVCEKCHNLINTKEWKNKTNL